MARTGAGWIVAAILVVCAVTAQERKPKFEVASVKPALSPVELGRQAGRQAALGAAQSPTSFGIRTFPGGRLSGVTTLRQLIARAYGVKDYEIQGGPPWVGSNYFAVDARANGDATDTEFNEMLTALLADRFAMRTHQEYRPGKLYALRLARADRPFGSGLKRTSDECVKQIDERKRNPPPPQTATGTPSSRVRSSTTDPAECGHYRITTLSGTVAIITFSGYPISKLTDHISEDLGANVVDGTGLEGLFDIFVEYERPQGLSPGASSGLDPGSTESPKPPLPNALERQLGLKLQTTTGDISVLVIDAVEKPSPD